MNPVVKGLHYNFFWIIIFNIQRFYFREYFLSLFSTEAVAWRCSVKKMLLQILQNSQQNTCTQSPFKKRETVAQVFSWAVAACISVSYWSHCQLKTYSFMENIETCIFRYWLRGLRRISKIFITMKVSFGVPLLDLWVVTIATQLSKIS